MHPNAPDTCLLALLRELTPKQRPTFAEWAGTTEAYLYQLATCKRKRLSARLALDIEAASVRMNKRTRDRTSIVRVRDLVDMCACVGCA